MNQCARPADIARPGLTQKKCRPDASVLPPVPIELGYAVVDA